MKTLNTILLIATSSCWGVFFCEINNIRSYWAGVAVFLGLIALTAAYILTKPSTAKAMSEEPFVEQIEISEAWQDCYEEARKIQQNNEVEQILEELRRE